METILVTGSEGNIGTYLVSYLEKTRPDFRIIRVKLKENSGDTSQTGNIYIGDLADNSFVEKIFQADHIIVL